MSWFHIPFIVMVYATSNAPVVGWFGAMFTVSFDIRTVIFVRSIIIIMMMVIACFKYYCYCYYDDLTLIQLLYVHDLSIL